MTALSISSMHMNITSGLRRTSTPKVPIENSSADSSRYQVVVGVATATHRAAHRAVTSSSLRLGMRRARSTVPTTAMTSSTLVSSNANT